MDRRLRERKKKKFIFPWRSSQRLFSLIKVLILIELFFLLRQQNGPRCAPGSRSSRASARLRLICLRERARRAAEGRPSKFCSVLLTSGGAVDERVVPAGTRGFGRLLPPWRPTPLPFCRRQRVAALEDLERALRMSLWRARHSCERRRCGGQSTRSRRSWKFAASSIDPPRRDHLKGS